MSSSAYMTSEPIPGLTAKEAAVILDVTSESVHKYVCAGIIHKGEKNARGGLDRDTVEQVSLARWPLRRRPGPHPYWATTREAAEVLGVSRARVRQLAESGRIPAVWREDGHHWYFRRHQLEVVANAREARKWADA